MRPYCFVSTERFGVPGVAIFADNLRQAQAYVRGSAFRYIGSKQPKDTTGWWGVSLSKDLQTGYDSLVANGASKDSLAYYCKRWAFSPKGEVSHVAA